ncbi:MAG: PEP-CTERM sorting domain-containing protein [Akkermansiaceae bacterium]|jgi:hypothetical protein
MIYPPLGRLCLACMFGFTTAHAATLANFNFTGGSLFSSASSIPGMMVSSLSSESTFNSFTSSSGWDSAAQISGAAGFFSSPTNHSAAKNAVFFTISAASGYSFSLDGFSFIARSTATAPTDIGFKINSTLYDFSASYSNESTITSISNSSLGFSGLSFATICIQAWNASSSGALQLDDIILTGTVIPEPSTAVLVTASALTLLRRRR